LAVPSQTGSVQHDGPWFLEDYAPGDIIHHHAGMTLTETEHAAATRLYQNTAKVHFDARLMAGTRSGKRLVYGGHVISMARALAFNGFENALRILAWNGGAHTNPVFAGDTLYASPKFSTPSPCPAPQIPAPFACA
jgi:2-methylfumaryl-CoA hydratase